MRFALVVAIGVHAPATQPAAPSVEERLAEQMATLAALAEPKELDLPALGREIPVARRHLEAIAADAEGRKPVEATVSVPARVPLVLPQGVKGATPDGVRALWLGQLRLNLRLAAQAFEKARKRDRLAASAGTIEPHLAEAAKCHALLSRPADVLRVKKGEVLFADDFSKGTENWLLYGRAETTVTPTGLRQRNLKPRNPWADTMIWTKPEFTGNFVLEFTFTVNERGTRGEGGALFAICGRPRKKDTDLSVSCGQGMDSYNYGVHAYHFSLHRGTTGVSNGRKVGSGLKMLCGEPDPATEDRRPYRVAIAKWGDTVLFMVDGKLIHSYVDAGTYGPALDGGHVGMRHWFGLDATYGDVRVYRLIAEAERKAEGQ